MNSFFGRLCVLASRQHEVAAVWQLRSLGWSRTQVDAATRGLRRVHRGVVALGDLAEEGWLMAAALAAGPGGVVSHLSALMLMGLRPYVPHDIHVTRPGRGGVKRRDGLVVHRPTRHPEVGTFDGIPVTSPTQALLDADLRPHELYRALEQAERRGLQIHLLNDVVRLCSAVQGTTRSDSEAKFILLCHEHGLPLPLVNQHLNGFETDFHWPDARLVVEVDGFQHHRERDCFDRDRYRGLVHRANGWEVVRISADHVHDEPALVLRALGQTFGGPESRSSRWSKPGRESRANSRAAPASSVTGPNT